MVLRHRKCSYHLIRRFISASLTEVLPIASRWTPTIGVEVHAQIASKSKLFSRSQVSFSSPPNTCVSFFDAALPGTLPVLNIQCVNAAVLAGLALNCTISPVTNFDRKHYFYQDLPAGYQITQHFQPIAKSGYVDYVTSAKSLAKRVQIRQIQLEQDSGKSLHDSANRRVLIDLNRCGVGLLEIVTEPEFSTAHEVCSFIRELRLILVRLGINSGRMEEGQLRVDANVSVAPSGSKSLGIRTEIKNLNSIRSISKAIEFEIDRQVGVLQAGRSIVNETRSFDSDRGVTVAMRDKERIFDYRFMPEPNLPELRLIGDSDCPINVDEIRQRLPKLPAQRRQELREGLELRSDLIERLVDNADLMLLFERCLQHRPQIPTTPLANFLLIDVLGTANAHKIRDISDLPADRIAEIVQLKCDRRLSSVAIRSIIDDCLVGKLRDKPVEDLMTERQIEQINDPAVIEAACREVLSSQPKAVADFRRGKKRAYRALMGQLLKEKNGALNPKMVDEILTRLLG